jgi:hypothetical protein
MRSLTLPTIDGCPHDNANDTFLIGDLPTFADRADKVPSDFSTRRSCGGPWTGGMNYNTAMQYTRTGDLSGVAASDVYLAKFEALAPMRSAWERRTDVIGTTLDVGAYMADRPMHMRRRVRTMVETAPLTVAVDLVSSGDIDSDMLVKRGALILALVRALSITRPVELWVGGSATPASMKGAWHVWFKLDTAPLDLARAAHVMTSPAVSRGMIYATIEHEAGSSGGSLHWPYCDHKWSRANMRPVLSRAFGQADMLTIAAPHSNDELINKPEAWFERMLAEYGGVDHDA